MNQLIQHRKKYPKYKKDLMKKVKGVGNIWTATEDGYFISAHL